VVENGHRFRQHPEVEAVGDGIFRMKQPPRIVASRYVIESLEAARTGAQGGQRHVQGGLGHRWRGGEDFQRLEVDRSMECLAVKEGPVSKPDTILKRIEEFNRANGGGVVIEKRSKGYSLFREDNGRPIARLRPSGKDDQVEILWWSHRDKWEQIGNFGPMLMPLGEALRYIVRDPIGVFWG
jgi:hypothetical protein